MADNSAVPSSPAASDDGAGSPAAVGALEQRIRELEAENARLTAGATASAASPAGTAARRSHTGWWRALLSALCIVVASVLVPVSVVGAWARAELVDENQFVATLAPLSQNSSVQDLLIDETMKAINEKVDFAKLTGEVINGIAGLQGMPPRVADALGLLKQPAASGLQSLVQGAVTKVVQSPAFSDVWSAAVRDAHRALTNVSTSDGGGVVVLNAKGLGIQLGPIIDQVKQRLTAQGIGAASLIPSVNKTIIVGDGSAVSMVRTVYGIAVTAGWWLPVVALVLFILGILLARRRSVAVVGTGVGLAIGAGALAIGLSAGTAAVGVAASQLKLSSTALDYVYTQLTDLMSHTAVILVILGVFIIVTGWALGSWSSSRRMRSVFGGLNSSARTALAGRGLDTGRFGVGLFRLRTVTHVVAVVAAIVWLLLLRPLSFGDIVLVIVVILLITWVLELLQKRPGEEPTRTTAAGSAGDSDSPREESGGPAPDEAAPEDTADQIGSAEAEATTEPIR